MASPLLIVVQGAPGSGKTTLLQALRRDLTLPMLGKDDIKELLFDRLPQSDREFSTTQGKAAIAMLFAFAESLLRSGHDVLIESAFYSEFATEDVESILHATDARCFEVYCYVDEAVRLERFRARAVGGSRHPAHMDQAATTLHGPEKYVPLEVSEGIRVDMTHELSEKRYDEIIAEIRQRLEKKENE